MLSGHTQMNLLVCNFVHQARAAQASQMCPCDFTTRDSAQGRPGQEVCTHYDDLGLRSNRPVYVTLHPNVFIIASYNGHSLAFAPRFSYNSGAFEHPHASTSTAAFMLLPPLKQLLKCI